VERLRARDSSQQVILEKVHKHHSSKDFLELRKMEYSRRSSCREVISTAKPRQQVLAPISELQPTGMCSAALESQGRS